MSQKYFEDFEVGEEFLSAGYTLTESDIIDFALKYDPQPMHMNVEAAKSNIYGGLIASGWHVGALAFRLFLQLNLISESSAGSPGLDEVRWLKPVRPGDTIYMKAKVDEVRPSRSRPERGNISMSWNVVNQRDEVVMSYRSVQMILRRPGGD